MLSARKSNDREIHPSFSVKVKYANMKDKHKLIAFRRLPTTAPHAFAEKISNAHKLETAGWLIIAMFAFAACNPKRVESPEPPEVGLPNPASIFCERQSGRLVILRDAQGGEYWVCHFSDGSQCEEWVFLRCECQSGMQFKSFKAQFFRGARDNTFLSSKYL